MDTTLSRRLALVMMSKAMFEKSVLERSKFIEEASKYESFASMPEKLKATILSAEKNAQ